MIDRRELLDKAREKGLTLGMIEKDYVLGWLLFGLKEIRGLTFKGGTALSKIYFPTIWRLSEDLDFVYKGDFQVIIDALPGIFEKIEKISRIRFVLKSRHSNPEYLQLKIRYDAVLGRNWIKMDVTREVPVDQVLSRKLSQTYSDYPSFKVAVESIEEICSEKIRALVERKKSRDYNDVWQMIGLKLNKGKLKHLLVEKFRYKGIEFMGLDSVIPDDLSEILEGYWDRELGRLMQPVPEMGKVIEDLRRSLRFLMR